MVANTFIPDLRIRGRQNSESEASLVYRERSKTARDAQRNPVLKNNNNTTTKERSLNASQG